ncbi:hypothetical protein COCOBI_15-3020 [Coccomyxa sp. Obi]|nr:hypothetical protein COCOBI_15-3020 [Coccomyxa sp. Obi]
MTPLSFERLLKAYMLAAITITVTTLPGKQGMIGEAVQQGDPNAVAVAILGHLAGQPASMWPENCMHWLDATKHGAALAGEALILVVYSQIVTHDGADELCQLILSMRTEPENNIGTRHIYGAVAGLQLSGDAEDIQQLLDTCRRHAATRVGGAAAPKPPGPAAAPVRGPQDPEPCAVLWRLVALIVILRLLRMTVLVFKVLLKACLLAAIAFVTSLPTAAARVLHSADELQSEIGVPDVPKEIYGELKGKSIKMDSGSRKVLSLSVPKGCNSENDMSKECRDAQEFVTSMLLFAIIFGPFFIMAGVYFISYACYSCFCKPNHQPQQAPNPPGGPSQEMASASTFAANKRMPSEIEQAIKQGDPKAIAVAILGQLAGRQATSWPETHMHWVDTNKDGAASVGSSFILVYYTPVLTHEAADRLCHVFRSNRHQAQSDNGKSLPLKWDKTAYGAVAGLLLSEDVEDVQLLSDKCKHYGWSIWLPSGCLQEGRKHAAYCDVPSL